MLVVIIIGVVVAVVVACVIGVLGDLVVVGPSVLGLHVNGVTGRVVVSVVVFVVVVSVAFLLDAGSALVLVEHAGCTRLA